MLVGAILFETELSPIYPLIVIINDKMLENPFHLKQLNAPKGT